MKVIFDPETDSLTIIFSAKQVTESDETKPGVILDATRMEMWFL